MGALQNARREGTEEFTNTLPGRAGSRHPEALPGDFCQKDTGRWQASSVPRSQPEAPLPEAGSAGRLSCGTIRRPDSQPRLREGPSCTRHLHPGGLLDQQQTQSLAGGFLSANQITIQIITVNFLF